MKLKKHFLGLGKTKFNSSVCITSDDVMSDTEIFSTERLTRNKNSGAWPKIALKKIEEEYNYSKDPEAYTLGENRDVHTPIEIENAYDTQFPFFAFLEKSHLKMFSSKFNPNIIFITHHDCHAYAALAMSPFDRSIIIVLDGAGSASEHFNKAPTGHHEECSIYLQNQGVLTLIKKRWAKFEKNVNTPEHAFSKGIGLLYEKASEYIFNNETSSGKVMGLASFGKSKNINDRLEFQNLLDWTKAFKSKTKVEWEKSESQNIFQNLAASVQAELEKDYEILLQEIKNSYPSEKNLILTGGCALNCTNNGKILYSNYFDEIYVSPFPGDESIGFGITQYLKLNKNPEKWKKIHFKSQSAYFGSKKNIPNDSATIDFLKKEKINFKLVSNLTEEASEDLLQGKILGWFQGRSESGPRALGNRSILVRPDRADIKNYLNNNIKFREKFRPYGCSVIHDYAYEYFDVPKEFNNPYMSFAIKVRAKYLDILKEITHVDQTSRMQSVRPEQNLLFYELIKVFGEKSGIYCLLNTSLNIMGEPIVESLEDAVRLFQKTPVDILYIGNVKIDRANNL